MFRSHTKSFHPGRPAQSELMAAILLQSGYTSSEQVIADKRSWANPVRVTKTGIPLSLEVVRNG
jgi:aconitate decarboxylase